MNLNLVKPIYACSSIRFLFRLLVLMSMCSYAIADEIFLNDGSRLKGNIKQITNKTLFIDTAFASNLEIKTSLITGITTTEKKTIQLQSGETLTGLLQYSEDDGQKITGTKLGDISLTRDTSTGNWNSDMLPAKLLAETSEPEKEESKIMTELYSDYIKPWSGKVGVGISGEQGNTENFELAGRVDAKGDFNDRRVETYLEFNYETQNQVETTNEILAGGSFERDINQRWYAFGSVDLESDEFESLSLRSKTYIGLGRFLIRRPDLELKVRGAAGYQFERFTNGVTEDDGIGSFGYDFKYTHNDLWEIGHRISFLPFLDRITEDFRTESRLYTELPLLSAKAPWKVRFSLRNEYDSRPQPGVENLDTTYNFDVVYDFR